MYVLQDRDLVIQSTPVQVECCMKKHLSKYHLSICLFVCISHSVSLLLSPCLYLSVSYNIFMSLCIFLCIFIYESLCCSLYLSLSIYSI